MFFTLITILAILLSHLVQGGAPGTYCGLEKGTLNLCRTGVCRGPWVRVDNEKLGHCCLKTVGDGCTQCRLNSAEDNLLGNAGFCTKCKRHLSLKDGKCFNKCSCRASNRLPGQQCCPRCAHPCKIGECVQRANINICEVQKGEYEYATKAPSIPIYANSSAPTHKPTKQPN